VAKSSATLFQFSCHWLLVFWQNCFVIEPTFIVEPVRIIYSYLWVWKETTRTLQNYATKRQTRVFSFD